MWPGPYRGDASLTAFGFVRRTVGRTEGRPESKNLAEGCFVGNRPGDLVQPVGGDGAAGKSALDVGDRPLDRHKSLFENHFM